MTIKHMDFQYVPVGAEFECNGNRCRKVSTRTADILDLTHARRFYFGKRERCTVPPPARARDTERAPFDVMRAVGGKGGAS